MLFDWDEEKAKSNLVKHGVTFDEATSVFDDPLFLTFGDPEHSLQEQRFLIMGESARGRLLVVSYTDRNFAYKKHNHEYARGDVYDGMRDTK